MEEEQESWSKFLQDLDKQISSKFLFQPLSDPALFSLLLIDPSFGFRAEAFPGSGAQAAETVKKLREFRAAEAAERHEAMDPEWGVEDWLYSVRGRIASVKRCSEIVSQLVEAYCIAL